MIAIATTTLRRFLRDRSNIFYVFLLPFLIIILVGYGAGSASRLPVGVVGADTPLGAAVLAELTDTEIEDYATADEAARAVGDIKVSGAIIFPAEGETIRFINREGAGLGSRARLDAAISGINERRTVAALADAAGIDPAQVEQARENLPATTVTVDRIGKSYWEGLESIEASALTQTVLFTFLAALTASAMLVQDRITGMARRKAAAPISAAGIVSGEVAGRLLIAAFQGLLIVVATALAFGVDWGNLPATGLTLALFAMTAAGAGVLLGTVIDRPESAGGLGILIALVGAVLGGAMAPVELFPPLMQSIARATPHYWAIQSLTETLVGGSFGDVGTELAVLVAFAAVLLAVSSLLFHRKIHA